MIRFIVYSYIGKYHLSVPSTGSTFDELDALEDIVSDSDPSGDKD